MNEERKALCLNPLTISSKLEEVAQQNANNLCSENTTGFKGYNYFYNYFTTTGLYDFDYLQGKMLTSYSTSKSKWSCGADTSSSSTLSDALFFRYSLVSSQTIGCAFTTQSSCKKTTSGKTSNAYYFVCVYGTYPSAPVISSTNCAACNGGDVATTQPPVKVTSPPATTQPPVKVTSPPATTQPPVIVTPATTQPPSTTKPTVAPVTPSPSPSSSTEKDLWMKAHNDARTCVGIPSLQWDDQLAKDAKAWANVLAVSCNMVHSSEKSSPPRIDQGENLWYIMRTKITQQELIAGGVGMWVDERYDWDCSRNTCSGVCTHYTQMIWRNTTKVGCAYSLCKTVANKYQGVCRYSVKGNWGGANPLAPKVDCAYKCGSTTRSISSASSPASTNNKTDFFKTDYELAIFILCSAIVVVVLSVFILLLVSMLKRRQVNEEDYYQALLKK